VVPLAGHTGGRDHDPQPDLVRRSRTLSLLAARPAASGLLSLFRAQRALSSPHPQRKPNPPRIKPALLASPRAARSSSWRSTQLPFLPRAARAPPPLGARAPLVLPRTARVLLAHTQRGPQSPRCKRTFSFAQRAPRPTRLVDPSSRRAAWASVASLPAGSLPRTARPRPRCK
jgi:hypothetical protein